ncbi:ABC transporter permease [Actinomycetospora chibensis]|uniref:ABC transporter permease n=1 Tax=Actinomycetospora chibensis TaxID=663606 RepID=A0ABV9RCY6_9PSEU|nr:ABC transporter permease [Actinomycetospora chibensis]MDD7925105.1 ABC transporter permease [Actinomycetospora chibensis]
MSADEREAPTKHAPGPFEGVGPRVVGVVPDGPRSVVAEVGGMIALFGKIVWSVVRKPYGFWAESLDYFFTTLRRSALPMAAAIFGFLLFFSLVVVIFFSQAGAVSLGTAFLFQYGFRAFTVFVVAVVVSGVAGAALTTDLGARKIREELDAMTVMGIDPVRELVVPRAISLIALTTLISLPGLAVTAVGLQLGAGYYGHLSAADFYHSLFSSLSPPELFSVLINCFMLGILITTVCCYKGLNAGGGSIGLGRAVNQAVVVCYVALFVFQLAYNAIFLGLFPELGRVR